MAPTDDDERAYRRNRMVNRIPGGMVAISGLTREDVEAAHAKYLAWLEANRKGFKDVLYLEPGQRLEMTVSDAEEDHEHR